MGLNASKQDVKVWAGEAAKDMLLSTWRFCKIFSMRFASALIVLSNLMALSLLGPLAVLEVVSCLSSIIVFMGGRRT